MNKISIIPPWWVSKVQRFKGSGFKGLRVQGSRFKGSEFWVQRLQVPETGRYIDQGQVLSEFTRWVKRHGKYI
jgi:hypothetical protein